MRHIATCLLLFCCLSAIAQDEIPRNWDIDKCYYDKDSARYILLEHRIHYFPDIEAGGYFLSIWDVTTGKLVKAYRFRYDKWMIDDYELKEFDNFEFNNKINRRYDPPFYNGTYFYVVNNTVKVYYRDYNDSVKFVIHPQEVYPKLDFSGEMGTVKSKADALLETQKQNGYSLLMRLDTVLPMATTQSLNLNRKNLRSLVDKYDCNLFVVTATDSLLALNRNVIFNNSFNAYIDSSLQIDEQTMTYQLGFAGNTKDVKLSFNHEWSTAKTPVTVLLLGKANGEVSQYLTQSYEEAVVAEQDSIKAITAIRALVKSKMLPGDKLVLDTLEKVEPIPIGDGTYQAAQNVFFTDFDKKYNRTMYVAVKSSQDSLIISGHYYPGSVYKYMPPETIKKFNTNGYTIYRCSFTGDINIFDIEHYIQSTTHIYYFITKRLDEKGFAANKKYFDEWDGIAAKNKEETEATGNYNRGLASDFSEIKSTIEKMAHALNDVCVDNLRILNSGSPSVSTYNQCIGAVFDETDKIKKYILSNESKINTLGANKSAYENYFNMVFGLLQKISDAKDNISRKVNANNNGEKADLNGIKAAIFDIEMAASDISAKSYNYKY